MPLEFRLPFTSSTPALTGTFSMFYRASALLILAPPIALGQEIVTLWQFGNSRLAAGEHTLPLVPEGTTTYADGAVATTFLYRVVEDPTQIVKVQPLGETLTTTTPITIFRTIIASASGWFEPFSSGFIECAFGGGGTTHGECINIDSTTTSSGGGTALPEVFSVTTLDPTSTSASTTASQTTSTTLPGLVSPEPTTLSPAATARGLPEPTSSNISRASSLAGGPRAGTIAGGIVGGIAFLTSIALLFICCRRRARAARRTQLDAEGGSRSRMPVDPFLDQLETARPVRKIGLLPQTEPPSLGYPTARPGEKLRRSGSRVAPDCAPSFSTRTVSGPERDVPPPSYSAT
uniref:Uncharacterized protein n=1 Tax=Mycena chlorophos TaxID=658473 RepID=A0ABQ0LLI8_MYCCL|nr:predicted protein [Mycena chlorophos]